MFIMTNLSPHNCPTADWHPADIVAALRKRAGLSLRQLSLREGLSPTALGQAIHRPLPAYEAMIAAAIGIQPEQIWPSRYQLRAERSRRMVGRRSNRSLAARGASAKADF